MEIELIKKMSRYVELSTKFSKGECDIFTGEELRNNYSGTIYHDNGLGTSIGSSNAISVTGKFLLNGKEIYVDMDGNVKSRDNEPLTRADQIKAKAHVRAVLSDEYDEYLKLRNSLNGYFEGVNNLIEE